MRKQWTLTRTIIEILCVDDFLPSPFFSPSFDQHYFVRACVCVSSQIVFVRSADYRKVTIRNFFMRPVFIGMIFIVCRLQNDRKRINDFILQLPRPILFAFVFYTV